MEEALQKLLNPGAVSAKKEADALQQQKEMECKAKEPSPSPTPTFKKCYSFPKLQQGLRESMESLCDDDANSTAAKLCDASFAIGRDRQPFFAVSALFAVHSSVLEDLLRANKGTDSPIELDAKISPNCFRFLREYFYALNPAIGAANVSEILFAAQTLKIDALREAATSFIMAMARIDDIVQVLTDLHRLELYAMCRRKIGDDHLLEDAAKIFHCDRFNILPTKLLRQLLEEAQFKTVRLSEEEVFQKCVAWAECKAATQRIIAGAAGAEAAKVNEVEAEVVVEEVSDASKETTTTMNPDKEEADPEDEVGDVVDEVEKEVVDDEGWKEMMKPILSYIRFPIMNGEYFAGSVFSVGRGLRGETKLLSAEDSTSIMQYQLTKKENETLRFNTKTR